LEESLKVPLALREKNGGNPWPSTEVATAVGLSAKSYSFFYITAASRDYGLTIGTRDTKQIALAELGRKLMYAGNPTEEYKLKLQAFLNVDLFKRVLEHYGGNNLPEMKYLSNTLESTFGISPNLHEEFSRIFKANCDYLQIGARFAPAAQPPVQEHRPTEVLVATLGRDVYTVAEAEAGSGLVCFAAMPFRERTDGYMPGYFAEVLNALIAPAGRKAGFTVQTARKEGTDVIQSTIVNRLLSADLVLIDLTEHNPNVLFELGLCIARERPVVLIRAAGTAPIFDVDNMLRVFDYTANLWPSTLETDIPKLAEHITATYSAAGTERSYMKILLASTGLAT